MSDSDLTLESSTKVEFWSTDTVNDSTGSDVLNQSSDADTGSSETACGTVDTVNDVDNEALDNSLPDVGESFSVSDECGTSQPCPTRPSRYSLRTATHPPDRLI